MNLLNISIKIILVIASIVVILCSLLYFDFMSTNFTEYEYVIIRCLSHPSETIDIEFTNPRSVADKNLINLMNNHTAMWIGGIVQKGLIGMDNTWGFHFKPDTIAMAEITAEGLQTWLSYINGTIDYWNGNYAYIWASVVDYEHIIG